MRFLTANEIAKTLNISYHKALEFIRFSGVDYIKIGNQYRVAEDKFNAFVMAKGNKII